MKKLILVFVVVFITIQYNAQNYNEPSAEQQAEWRKIAHEEGQKSMGNSVVMNFFRNKFIFLVIGGVIVLIGTSAASSKNHDKD